MIRVRHLASLACTLLPAFAFTALAQTNTFPSSGSVGIGTTSPAGTLDVANAFYTPAQGMLIVRPQNTSGEGAELQLQASPGYYPWIVDVVGNSLRVFTGTSYTGNENQLQILNCGTGSAGLFVQGRTGIGTYSPAAKLDVQSNGYSALRLFDGAGDSATIDFRRGSDNWYLGQIKAAHSGAYGTYLSFKLHPNDGVMNTQPTEAMSIFPDGNVRAAGALVSGGGVLELNNTDTSGGSSDTSGVRAWNTIRLYSTCTGYTSNANYGIQFSPRDGSAVFKGFVGIGNTAPGYKLDIGGSGTGPSAPAIAFNEWNTRQWAIGAGISQSGKLSVVNGSTGLPALTIDGNSNVGIGTANPTNKLEVNGTIRTKEVVVETTGWADHVLAKNYPLAPLSEVAAHIDAHGTLPGIQSAAEVARHGVNLGEMQVKLLAKLEELTLHQIAQEKRLDEQSSHIAKLQQENAELRAKVAGLRAQP